MNDRTRRRGRREDMKRAVILQRETDRLAVAMKRTKRPGRAKYRPRFTLPPESSERRIARNHKANAYFEAKVRPFTSGSR